MAPTVEEAVRMRGMTAVDRDGDKIGTIEDVYLDRETEQPEWLAVKTGFGRGLSFVPLAEATMQGDSVRVPYEKSQVKDAPSASADGELSQDEEGQLYRHYGLDYGEERSGSGLPEGGTTETRDRGTVERDRGTVERDRGTVERDRGTVERDRGTVGRDVSGPETDEAMTRSEEELRVGTARREAGRARLKKYVVTEQVQQTVPVEREEVRVQREPITEANIDQATSGADLTEEEHEVVLQEEDAVVDKRVVPKERVRLDKDTVREEQTVSDEVRKEVIEPEGDAPKRGGRGQRR